LGGSVSRQRAERRLGAAIICAARVRVCAQISWLCAARADQNQG
jgi:hypothetical protein